LMTLCSAIAVISVTPGRLAVAADRSCHSCPAWNAAVRETTLAAWQIHVHTR
jgi:hypothetical protein